MAAKPPAIARKDYIPPTLPVIPRPKDAYQPICHPSKPEESRPQNVPLIVRIWRTPENLRDAVGMYLAHCDRHGEPPLMSGLAFALGIMRRTLVRLVESGQGDAETEGGLSRDWVSPLKEAWTFIEACYELDLRGNQVAGPIFALKNAGWSDQPAADQAGNSNTPLFNLTVNVGGQEGQANVQINAK